MEIFHFHLSNYATPEGEWEQTEENLESQQILYQGVRRGTSSSLMNITQQRQLSIRLEISEAEE